MDEHTRKLGPPRYGKLGPSAFGPCVVCGRGSIVRWNQDPLCTGHFNERLADTR